MENENMIPSVLASRFREGLKDYMEITFLITSLVFSEDIRELKKWK